MVSPNVFELHAGSLNKRPAEYIYLENRKTLRSVMIACSKAALEALDEDIRQAVGSSIKKSKFCFNCKGCACAYSHLTCSTVSFHTT